MPHLPFYQTPAWREARDKCLRLKPHCEVCLRINIRTLACEVDHIVAMRAGGHPLDPSNLRSLCRKHHSQKTIMIDGQHAGSGKALVTTGIDGFPIHTETPRSIKRAPQKFK